jgi:hypothetical protein
MTRLERRIWLLLRAYPAQYRKQRGEEMLGTLLDTTPPGRTWPMPRDVRALLAGGLQARAAANRRLPLRANVRTAVFVGLAAFLGYDAVDTLSSAWSAQGALSRWIEPPWDFGWGPVISPALILMTVVLAWLSRRRAVVVVAAIPAWIESLAVRTGGPCGPGLASACSQLEHAFGHYFGTAQWDEIVRLACLVGLVAVAGGDKRPGRGWMWPVVLASLSPALLAGLPSGVTGQVVTGLSLTIGVVSIAWIAVDARPAMAAAVLFTALWLQVGVFYVDSFGLAESSVPLLLFGAVAGVAIWRLGRQSTGGPRQRA